MSAPGVQLGLGRLGVAREGRQGSNAGDTTGETSVSQAGRLNSHSLAHDGAAAGEHLQLRDGSAARRGGERGASSRRHGTEACCSRLHHKWAHGLGLAKSGVHGED